MEDYRLFCTSFHTSLRLFAVNFAVVYTPDAGFLHPKSIRKRLAAGLRLDPLGELLRSHRPIAAKRRKEEWKNKGKGGTWGRRKGRECEGGKGRR